MVKTSKIIATLGVAAGLGIALLPLASYAADNDSETVSVDVESWIEVVATNNAASVDNITALTDGAKVSMAAGASDNGLIHTVNVSGNYNKGYTLTALAGGDNLVGTNSSNIIPGFLDDLETLPEEGGLMASNTASNITYGWGYRWGTASGTYSGYTVNETTKGDKFTKVSSDAEHPDVLRVNESQTKRTSIFDEDTYVNYGFLTASNQPADVYSQTVTYTAAGSSFQN